MTDNNQEFDFSVIADDCESSDGQTRHIKGNVRLTPKTETAEKTA